MQIERIRTFLTSNGSKNLLFVKIETDDGIHGWGECYTMRGRDDAIERLVGSLGTFLIGRSPFDVKQFTEVALLDFAGTRGGMDVYTAMSGFEIACWDIIGKALGQPVYNLLGGACRRRIRVYANGWARGEDSPEAAARKASQVIERGFDALKWDPFPGPIRAFVDDSVLNAAIASVKAVRDAVGPDVQLYIDGHRRLPPMYALQVARALEDCQPLFYEELSTTEDLDSFAEVRRTIKSPVIAGEALFTKAEFRDVFEKRAADIINPDVTMCGGILALKELSAMAEPYQVAISPHMYNQAIGFAAAIQVSATIPNFVITDFFLTSEQFCREIVRPPFQAENGYIALPTAPGVGIDLDEDALTRNPFRTAAWVR